MLLVTVKNIPPVKSNLIPNLHSAVPSSDDPVSCDEGGATLSVLVHKPRKHAFHRLVAPNNAVLDLVLWDRPTRKRLPISQWPHSSGRITRAAPGDEAALSN